MAGIVNNTNMLVGGPAAVSVSTWSGGGSLPGMTTFQPDLAPYQPPAEALPLNTEGNQGPLLDAIFKVVEALDPAAAPALQQVEQALGLGESTQNSGGGSTLNNGGGGVTGSNGGNSGFNAGGATSYTSTNASDGSSSLAVNKAATLAACKAQGLTQDQTDAIMTIGSIETNDMNPNERDASKDGTASANYSAFNLNKGMLQAMGYNPDQGPNLNDPANLGLVVKLMGQAMNKFGLDGFLAWQRGGATGYADRTSYDVQGYTNAVKQGMAELKNNAGLLSSNSRIPTPTLSYEG